MEGVPIDGGPSCCIPGLSPSTPDVMVGVMQCRFEGRKPAARILG